MRARRSSRASNHLSGRSGAVRHGRRRLAFHHVPLAVASATVVVLLTGLSPLSNGRVSMSQFVGATGYVALALVGLTLLIGPLNLFLRSRKPASKDQLLQGVVSKPPIHQLLRRDVGTWAALASVVHTILGFAAHSGGGMLSVLDFFVANGRPLTSSFGLGNWTGLAALVIVVGLLAISTGRSMRELKARRWKNLQRLNYALFALVVLHAFFYGALLQMRSPLTLLLNFTVIAVFLGQAVGVWLWRQRYSRTGPASVSSGRTLQGPQNPGAARCSRATR